MSSTSTAAHAPTSAQYLELGTRTALKDLESVLLRGETPDLANLAGWEFKGLNTGLAAYLPIEKFVKGFYRAASGGVYGYNEPVVQNGPRQPWIAKPRDDDPKRFGFYAVEPVDAASKDNLYLRALLLNYGKGDNPLLDPSAGLRDYIVRVNPGSDDLLLGTAFYALGPARVWVGYFILERHRPTKWVRP
jgi:hypothetical protein